MRAAARRADAVWTGAAAWTGAGWTGAGWTGAGWTGAGRTDAGRADWRQLGRHLWVGHSGTASIGTIEQGSRYCFIDADGAPHPGFHTLHDAQQAAIGATPLTPPPWAAPAPRIWALIPPSTVLAAVIAAVAACWVLGGALFVS